MNPITNNLANHWHRYLVVLLMLALYLLRNKHLLTDDDVIGIQYALATMGFLPSKPQKLARGRSVRRAKRVLPFLLLFFLFQCKPKPVTVAEKAKAQVKENLTKAYEETIVAVESMPVSRIDSLVSIDPEIAEIFNRNYDKAQREQR